MEYQDISQGTHNSSVNPPLERHVRELQALYEIGQALCSVHDLDHLLQLATERVVTLLDIESVSIILLDEERDELYFAKVADDNRIGHEQHPREVRFPRFPARQGIAGWVMHEGQSQIVLDVDQDPRWYREVDVQTGTKTRSIMCAPLRTKDRIIGVLESINKIQGVFTIEDVRLLEAFANQLALALENARLIQDLRAAQERLSEENRYWREAMAPTVLFETIVGESPKMQDVYRLVQRVLNTTSNVLLTGESGTGKDLIARALHYQGPRAKGPFIAVNCAAIPETLLEAELFGYERGAYTGATQRKPGRFELAAGGTLFLNEIGDMSTVLQAKLLQVLQDRQFERLGGTETITTDARIIAATNQDLERLMTEKRFRRDLFYRLNVYPIALPPLREHQEDLGPLTMFFLKSFSQKLRKEVLGISKEAMALLERYAWPGNVRELENVIERAVILCQGTVVTAQDLPSLREQLRTPVLSGNTFRLPPGGIVLAEVEKALIRQALEQSHQNKSHAAKLLGLSRTQLRTRMRHYGLE
jgi:Nif-specific regulatory protein